MLKSLLLFISLGMPAQNDSIASFKSPKEIQSICTQLITDEKFDEALLLFNSISPNDTSYIEIQLNVMKLHNQLEKYEKTIEIGEKLKLLPSSLRNEIILILGNAYLNGGDNQKSIEVYQEGLDLYPYEYIYHYNIGYASYKLKDYEQANLWFKKTLKLNPFYGSAHIMLGYLSIIQGHVTKAMLSYMTYLALEPKQNETLRFLESIAKDGVLDEGSVEPFEDNTDFIYYDQLIRSKAALDYRFQRKVDFNVNIVKQAELLLSKLKVETSSEDFWMDMYVPFYAGLERNELSEAFIYFILQSANDDQISSWLKKNSKKQSAWIDLANSSLTSIRKSQELELLGERASYSVWFESNEIQSIGNYDGELRSGPWRFIGDNGQIESEGRFDQDNQVGLWQYFHSNGQLSRVEYYDESGEKNKPAVYYHETGALSIEADYKDDELDGDLSYYYECGTLKESLKYVAGEKNGKGAKYYTTGQIHLTYELVEGALSNDYIYYHKNGQISTHYRYENDLLQGPCKVYDIDGNLTEEGAYENDLKIGEWKGYHPDGQLQFVGSYDVEENEIGEWKYFSDQGKLSRTATFNLEGIRHGESEYFTDEGLLAVTETYNNGIQVKNIAYDSKGNVIHEAGHESGDFEFRAYFRDSNILRNKGTLKAGELSGSLETFYYNGNIEKRAELLEGKYDGKYQEFFVSGERYIECSYTNDLLDGYYREYYINGNIKQEGFYVEGNLEQLWKLYQYDGSLDKEIYYISNKLQGWRKEYDPQGILLSALKYDKDVLTALEQYDTLGNVYHHLDIKYGLGKYALLSVAGDTLMLGDMSCGEFVSDIKSTYQNGNIEYGYEVDKGVYHGDYMSKDILGSTEVIGQFKNDKRSGKWTWYNMSKMDANYTYQKGEKTGVSKTYFVNGQVSAQCNYENGVKEGACYYYDYQGELALTKLYDETLGFVNYISPQSGDTIAATDKGRFELKSYFDNGQLAVIQNFNHGIFNGTQTYFNEDGTVIEKTNYSNGDLNGLYQTFYADGSKLEEIQYQLGLVHGLSKRFFPSGQIQRETEYKYGEENGYDTIYDQSGTILSKTFLRNGSTY